MPVIKKLAVTLVAALITLGHQFRVDNFITTLWGELNTPVVQASTSTAMVYSSVFRDRFLNHFYDQAPVQAVVQLSKLFAAIRSLLTAGQTSTMMLATISRIMWTFLSLIETLASPIVSPTVVFVAKLTVVATCLHCFAFVGGLVVGVCRFFL